MTNSPIDKLELDELDLILAELQGQMVNVPATMKAKAAITALILDIMECLPKKIYPSYHDKPAAELFTGTDATLRETLQSTLDTTYNTGYNAALDDVKAKQRAALQGEEKEL